MSNNPRIVAQALEDLREEMTRWTVVASDTLAAASYTQRYGKECVDRAMHQAAIVLNQAEQDEERVRKAISDTSELVEKCIAAKSSSKDTLKEAQNALRYADSTLQEWESELAKALAWLERAEARLARAIEEYERARRALAQAQSAYERALSRYQACMSNKERTNCNSEASAVQAAEVDVRQAAAWVQAAEVEVMAAREEVEMAKARVACCRTAVGYASQAVSIAQQAEGEAEQAVNSSERGFEFAQAAERLSDTANERVIAEKEAAESMMAVTREAVSLTEEAAAHLKSADKAEDSSQKYSLGARQELQYRMGLLHELNRPTLFAEAAGGAGVQGSRPDTRQSNAPGNTIQFADKKGRQIAIRNYNSGGQAFIRAFDLAQGRPPENASVGIGGANAIVQSDGDGCRIKFQDVHVAPDYRKAGTAGKLLEQVIQFARDNGAKEIFGDIEDENARSFWNSQTSKGWSIVDDTRSFYGEARYKLE